MDRALRVLIVEDSQNDAELMRHDLEKAGLEVSTAVVLNLGDVAYEVGRFEPDVVLADHGLLAVEGDSGLDSLRSWCPDVPLIVVSGTNDGAELDLARGMACLEKGAADFVLKEHASRIPFAVARAKAAADQRAGRPTRIPVTAHRAGTRDE